MGKPQLRSLLWPPWEVFQDLSRSDACFSRSLPQHIGLGFHPIKLLAFCPELFYRHFGHQASFICQSLFLKYLFLLHLELSYFLIRPFSNYIQIAQGRLGREGAVRHSYVYASMVPWAALWSSKQVNASTSRLWAPKRQGPHHGIHTLVEGLSQSNNTAHNTKLTILPLDSCSHQMFFSGSLELLTDRYHFGFQI